MSQPPQAGVDRQVQPTAVVMRVKHDFDDTADTVPVQFRKKIPQHLKTDGVFRLLENEPGYLINQQGEWGYVIFNRGGVEVKVLLQLRHLVIGLPCLSMEAKLGDSATPEPLLHGWSNQTDGNVLENYVRTLWTCLRQQPEKLSRLGMSGEDLGLLFGGKFIDNVEWVIRGFTPDAKTLLQDGAMGTRALSRLPKVTPEWPVPGSRAIYLRLYTHIGSQDGLYAGQSMAYAWNRHVAHESSIRNSSVPHYLVARQATQEHRYMIPLMVWEPRDAVPAHVITMAEQTALLMFNSYHNCVKATSTNETHFALRNQYRFLDSVNRATRQETGWPDISVVSCNVTSPIFGFQRVAAIQCFTPQYPMFGVRQKTVYRQAGRLRMKTKGRAGRNLRFRTAEGKRKALTFNIPATAVQNHQLQDGLPTYLTFEIMKDGKPHEVPYFGCPSVGPYKNFGVASSLGIRLEWFDEQSSTWLGLPLQGKYYAGGFRIGVSNMNLAKAIQPWRKCMDIIQLLEGIDYEGPLNGFHRRLYFGLTDVKELVTNHLWQTAKWEVRPRKTRPVPEVADFDHNFWVMSRQWGNTQTIVTRNAPPPDTSDSWHPTANDQKANKICDLCRYMNRGATYGPGTEFLQCERDMTRPDVHVCKACSLLNRPCTFTARSIALDQWGRGPPNLHSGHSTGDMFARNPTGPHRFLAFHTTLSAERASHAQRIAAPLLGKEGLEVAARIADEIEEEEIGGLEAGEEEVDDEEVELGED